MTPLQSHEARIALCVPGVMATIFLPAMKRFGRGTAERFDRIFLIVFAASRLLLFALIFKVLHIEARGDVIGFYVPEAEAAWKGLLPYAGFPSSYAPLHAYLDGAVLSVWHSPLSIIFLAVLGEIAAVFVWLKVARAFCVEQVRRTAALLVLASPLSIQAVTIDGQDNVLLALALGVALYLILRNRIVASGAALGAGVATIKFLPLIYVPQFLLTVRLRWRWLVSLIAAVLLGYGFFLLRHIDPLFPIRFEGQFTSASDVPYLVGFITGAALPKTLFDGILILLLCVAYGWLGLKVRSEDLGARIRLLTFGSAMLIMLLMTFAKKSWPNYLMLVLFNLCLLPAFRSMIQRTVFGLFQMLGNITHSSWASFLNLADTAEVHRRLLAHDHLVVLFLFQQVLLIAGYFWLLALLVMELRRRGMAGKGKKAEA